MRTTGSLDDLMAYVAKRVRLRKTGRGWVGLCPFHNEKTPSFGIFVGKRGEGRYHCLAPEIPVLMADLTKRQLGDVRVGDVLLGFDEYPTGTGVDRRFRPSKVLSVKLAPAHCVKTDFDVGDPIVSTLDHRWLERRRSDIKWRRASDRLLNNVVDLASPFDREESWLAGYIAGILDGEGSIVFRGGERRYQVLLTITQKPGIVLDTICEILAHWRVSFSQSLDNRGVMHLQIGSRRDVLSVLSRTRPLRLLQKWNPDKLGGIKSRMGKYQRSIVGRTAVGIQEVVLIGTSTKTFIADGLASHNCHGCNADGDLGDWLREVEHEESGRRRTVVRPPMPDIRQPAPHCVYLGDDPAAWARHHFREYDDYCRRHLPDELIEVARIDQNRRLIEAERNALLEETAPDADASPTSSDAFRAWVRAERAAGPVEPDS